MKATTWRGVRITTAERTLVDLARTVGIVDAVALGDAMVRRGFTTAAKLRRVSDACSGRHVVVVRRAGSVVRPRVDSPIESRLRLLLVFAGLPCPEPGLEIRDDDGQWVATVDLQYARARIAVEYDSDLHRTLKRKWHQDVAGRDRLRELGWQGDCRDCRRHYVRPHRTLERVHDALRVRGGEAVPSSLDPRWRAQTPRLIQPVDSPAVLAYLGVALLSADIRDTRTDRCALRCFGTMPPPSGDTGS